jgi:hypothetical protein
MAGLSIRSPTCHAWARKSVVLDNSYFLTGIHQLRLSDSSRETFSQCPWDTTVSELAFHQWPYTVVKFHNWNMQMIVPSEPGWIAAIFGQELVNPDPVRSPNSLGVLASIS